MSDPYLRVPVAHISQSRRAPAEDVAALGYNLAAVLRNATGLTLASSGLLDDPVWMVASVFFACGALIAGALKSQESSLESGVVTTTDTTRQARLESVFNVVRGVSQILLEDPSTRALFKVLTTSKPGAQEESR